LPREQGIPGAKKKNSNLKLKNWIKDDELKLPEFDVETIESLKGNLNYPDRKVKGK